MSKAHKGLRVAPSAENYELGPLISKRQMATISNYQAQADDLKVISEVSLMDSIKGKGYFITPKLFRTDNYLHVLTQEEIFGPI